MACHDDSTLNIGLGIITIIIIILIPLVAKIPGIKTKKVKNIAGMALVQFGGDRKGTVECYWISMLNCQ